MELEQLEKRLASLSGRTLRYQYIIQLGRRLPPMPPELKNDDTMVRGCMSPAWLSGGLDDDDPPALRFVGDSESVIVKGLFAILAGMFNGKTPDAALAIDLSDVFDRLGLGDAPEPQPAKRLLFDGGADPAGPRHRWPARRLRFRTRAASFPGSPGRRTPRPRVAPIRHGPLWDR